MNYPTASATTLGTTQPGIDDAVWDRFELASAYERAACARLAAERIAHIDALTGLANRRAAIEALEAEVARAQRKRDTLGVFLFDVDRFKVVNDQFGHDAGDRVLVAIANRARATLRPYDTLARWGGDEFLVLTPATQSLDVLSGIGEAIWSAIRASPVGVSEDRAISVTVSVGAILLGSSSDGCDALVRGADEALYAAKRRGSDCLVVAADQSDVGASVIPPETLRLAEALAAAAAARPGGAPTQAGRIADLAVTAGVLLGLDREALARTRLGGLLVDVGRLVLPDAAAGDATTYSAGAAFLRNIPGLQDTAATLGELDAPPEAAPIETQVVAAATAYVRSRDDGQDVSATGAAIRGVATERVAAAVTSALAGSSAPDQRQIRHAPRADPRPDSLEEIGASNALGTQIDRAIEAHAGWKTTFNAVLKSEVPLPDPADVEVDDRCDLGVWLATLPAGIAMDPLTVAVRAHHHVFHETAGDVARLIARGDVNAARALLDDPAGRYLRATSDVIIALARWRNSAERL